jgi:hypothetical protein
MGGMGAAASPLAPAAPSAPASSPKQIVSVTKNLFPIARSLCFWAKPPAAYLRQADPATNKILHRFFKKGDKILSFNFREKEVTFLKKSNQKTFAPPVFEQSAVWPRESWGAICYL